MKLLLTLLVLLSAILTQQIQAAQVFMRPSVAMNKSAPGLPDVANEDVQNQMYQTNVTVLPGILTDSHYNLEIWAQDDLGNPIDITSITSLTRTITTNQTASTFTWNGALIAPDSDAAPVAQTYNAAGVNNTASGGLWYMQLVGTDLTNKAVREVVISGAAIDSTTLGGTFFDDKAGFVQTMTWSATVNNIAATPVSSTVTVIPEPSVLGSLGLLAIGFLRRKR